ncbi:MAG: hypothetical protein PUK09_05410, partial [Bacilli bacterium]|nr:hypothetical protein [Bacilli bacterium]
TEKLQNLEFELNKLKVKDPLGIKATNETLNAKIDELNKRIDDLKNETEAKIKQIIDEITPIITNHAKALNVLLNAK